MCGYLPFFTGEPDRALAHGGVISKRETDMTLPFKGGMDDNTGFVDERYIDIVFDGPPGHDAPRFVEVENTMGRSVRLGEWIKRADGYWVIRFTPEDADLCS